MKALLIFFLACIYSFATEFTNYGPSSINCKQNFDRHVASLLEEIGVSDPQVQVHFTQSEYEILEAVIEGEKEEVQSSLTLGYLKRKEALAPSEDMYDNYRFKVIALMREIGIPDEKMVGLPLHFTRTEHEGLQELTADQDYDTALNLIRGFVSHKVQINPNDVCIANSSMMEITTNDQTLSPQIKNDDSETSNKLNIIDVSPPTELPSPYFKKFPKIKKIW